jgi:hypothetical protein
MKRPVRRPSLLSKSLNNRLNEYTLVATAAGVGALVLAVPAEAKIVYTPAHVVIKLGQPYLLDLNGDGLVDFRLSIYRCTTSTYCSTTSGRTLTCRGANSYSQIGVTSTSSFGNGYAAALRRGSRIPIARSVEFTNLAGLGGGFYFGNWFNAKNRYLALKFRINGKKHFGWARLSVETHKHPFTIKGVLTGYAYETVANKPIIAGKTHGPDVITVQSGSLGRLAQGASGR